jgi:hypothetical protein
MLNSKPYGPLAHGPYGARAVDPSEYSHAYPGIAVPYCAFWVLPNCSDAVIHSAYGVNRARVAAPLPRCRPCAYLGIAVPYCAYWVLPNGSDAVRAGCCQIAVIQCVLRVAVMQ